jgi:hypothetical protein
MERSPHWEAGSPLGNTTKSISVSPKIRGIGAHRTWPPWISVNHLHGITGLEGLDLVLYQKLAKGD